MSIKATKQQIVEFYKTGFLSLRVALVALYALENGVEYTVKLGI